LANSVLVCHKLFESLYIRATIHKSFSQNHDYTVTFVDYTLSRSLGDSLLSRDSKTLVCQERLWNYHIWVSCHAQYVNILYASMLLVGSLAKQWVSEPRFLTENNVWLSNLFTLVPYPSTHPKGSSIGSLIWWYLL
jgi:hypothetical protein